MQPLNYCRQAKISLLNTEMVHPHGNVRKDCTSALNAIQKAEKFILPVGGRVLIDAELRGLDGIDHVSLPYQTMALEYSDSQGVKHISLATERDDDIALQHIFGPALGTTFWIPTCTILMPRKAPFLIQSGDRKGLPDVMPLDDACPVEVGEEPAVALLSLLNALACSNVHSERIEPKKSGKKVKAAHQFDSYHVLKVDIPNVHSIGNASGGHRSPREHLRRGHIRRLSDSRRIWVNACAVAAGNGAGKITKDYAIRCAA